MESYFDLRVNALNSRQSFLYSAVSSPWDCSKRFILHPLAEIFIPTPSQLLWEAFSHAAITARRLFVQMSVYVCIQAVIYTAELTGNVGLTKLPELRNGSKRVRTRFISIESPTFYRYVTTPHDVLPLRHRAPRRSTATSPRPTTF